MRNQRVGIAVLAGLIWIVTAALVTAAEPFLGFRWDFEHAQESESMGPAWTLTTVYGAPRDGNTGPAPQPLREFYETALGLGMKPIFRLEESWWYARGAYLDHPPTGTVEIPVGYPVELLAAPLAPPGEITWECSDPAVGMVDPSGVFQGLAAGTCRVSARDGQGREGWSAWFEVRPVVGMVDGFVWTEGPRNFLALGLETPLTWSVDDPSRATIDPVTGYLEALGSGPVTVAVQDGVGAEWTREIEVGELTLGPVVIGRWQKLPVGAVLPLNLQGLPVGELVWEYDPAVLEFDPGTMEFTARAPGTSQIRLTTTTGQWSNRLEVTVDHLVVDEPWTMFAVPGDRLEFQVRGGTEPAWDTTDPGVGTVDQTGQFTAVSAGVCRVTVTDGELQGRSEEITVPEVLVIAEQWGFFEQWVREWVGSYPEACFQYGNEIGGRGDPFATTYSSLVEGYAEALEHFYRATKEVSPETWVIAQGAASTTAFDALQTLGIDEFVDAYALHTYFKSVDCRQIHAPEGPFDGGLDPDRWHGMLLDHPGVDPGKPWIVTESNVCHNIQGTETRFSLPTSLGFLKAYRSRRGTGFHGVVWFTLAKLINGCGPQDPPYEGYEALRDFMDFTRRPPPEAPVMVDLAAHRDRDGISWAEAPTDGDLDGDGATYAAELLPQGESPAESLFGGIPFWMPPTTDGADNLVTCDGRLVELPRARVRRIHLIGAGSAGSVPLPNFPRAERGLDSEGTFGLLYSDGSMDSIPTVWSNFYSGGSHGEIPAAVQAHYHMPSGPTELRTLEGEVIHDNPSFLYDVVLDARPETPLRWLLLPDSPQILILAVTLETQPVDPLPPGIRIETNRPTYQAGDPFRCSLTTLHETGAAAVEARLAVILDWADGYWFWPGWSQDPGSDWGEIRWILSGERPEILLDFSWPAGAGAGSGVRLWAALLSQPEETVLDLDFCGFDYR